MNTAQHAIGLFRRRLNGTTRGVCIRLMRRHGPRRYTAACRRFGA